VDKKTKTRFNPQNPENKIKIWALYNGARVSGLKNSVSVGSVWEVRVEGIGPTVSETHPHE
jgi:hypothetical protein